MEMIETMAEGPRVKVKAISAYAAGTIGILANIFLILLYAQLGLQARGSEYGTLLGPVGELAGSANDLLGSLAAAFMIPVAVFLASRLPRRRVVRITQAAGLIAMALLAVGGPLLVFGVLAFDVATLNAVASYLVLCIWLFLTNRWLESSDDPGTRVTRFGKFVGAGYPVGFLIFGLGLLLPWMSWPQLVVFGVGIFVGLPAWLCIPVWFLVLGRHLRGS
jgi:MFS family permease